jgi:hypothetical protein
VVAEQHPPIGGHVVGAVFVDFRRRGVIVARANDLHLDQPRVEAEPDDVGTDCRDDEPHGVDGLPAQEGDHCPRHGAQDSDRPE